MSQQRNSKPRRLITGNDLQDGLKICSGHRLVDSSFLHLFSKLTEFNKMTFQCWATGIGELTVSNELNSQEDCFDVGDYFTNNKSDRLACTCLGGSNSVTNCNDIKDGLLSSNYVAANDRTYKDVLVLKDDRRMSITNDYAECFGVNSGSLNFKLFVR